MIRDLKMLTKHYNALQSVHYNITLQLLITSIHHGKMFSLRELTNYVIKLVFHDKIIIYFLEKI